MENELIKRIKLVGRSLDVGGGKGFGYVRQIEIIGKLDSINISAALEPTVVADLNDTLPIPDDAYDNVICFNTIEHVFDEHKLLAEMLRVIRPGGRLIITAPFLYRGHGTYGDYHRHTADYWESALVDQGWNTNAFVVQPLVWCPLSTALTSLAWFRGGIRGRVMKLFVMALELVRSMLPGRRKARHAYKDWALAFFIDGIKPVGAEEALR